MSRFLATLAIAFATALTAPIAAAEPPPAAITVRSGDLDLDSERGAARMLRRIERAADQVCGRSIAATYMQRDVFRECRQRTIAAAVEQLNAETVSSLHAARYGAQPIQTADR